MEDGLPQGNVRTIAQSPDGALLIGTGGGMASFGRSPVHATQSGRAG